MGTWVIEAPKDNSTLMYVGIASGTIVVLFVVAVVVAMCLRVRRMRYLANNHIRTQRSSKHVFESTESFHTRTPLPLHLSHGTLATGKTIRWRRSPYLGNIVEGSFGKALPLIIFGGLSVAAGLLSLLLPETNGKVLPENITDAENFGKDDKTAGKSTGRKYYINNAFEKAVDPGEKF